MEGTGKPEMIMCCFFYTSFFLEEMNGVAQRLLTIRFPLWIAFATLMYLEWTKLAIAEMR